VIEARATESSVFLEGWGHHLIPAFNEPKAAQDELMANRPYGRRWRNQALTAPGEKGVICDVAPDSSDS
jgi:hypothetical protein